MRPLLLSLIATLLLVLLPQSQAYAHPLLNTLTVTTCTEAGFNTALTGANAGDTIAFACGGPATIPVTTTKTLSKNLTIDGNNGGNGVTFSGGNATRVFSITAASTIVLANLTVQNGSVSGTEKGGGIANLGTLTLTNVTLSNNNATGGASGAGIFSSGSLTIQNSHFLNNNFEGIDQEASSLNVQQSEFAGNFAGIHIINATATIDHSSIHNNEFGLESSTGSTVNLTNSNVSGNTSRGVDNENGSLTIQGTTFNANTNQGNPSQGQAALLSTGGSVTIDRSIFTNNVISSTTPGGGSALITIGGTITATNSTFAFNTTNDPQSGTIINSRGNVVLINSTISNNTNVDPTSAAVDAGTASVAPGSVVISNTTIAGNTGIGLLQVHGNTRLANSIVAENSGGNCGGTIIDGGNNLNDSGTCPGLAVANVLLEPLANNGGPTLTRLPEPASPALDKINQTLCPATDQRGVSRPMPVGGLCDIGAVERQPTVYLSEALHNFSFGW